MATSLVCIPAELLEQISSGLAVRDLLSLCKSCKNLYSKTHPLLFRHVTIAWNVAQDYEKPPRITRLLEFILRNRHYAQYIKRVDIDEIDYEDSRMLAEMWGNRTPLSLHLQEDESLATLVRDVISELCLPHSDKWYQGVVEDADLGAIIALLLAQCTHLERLKVDLNFIAPSTPWSPAHKWSRPGYNPWFSAMMRHAVSAPGGASRLSRFNKLTHFTVSTLRVRNKHPLELPKHIFFSSFYLPNITTLCLGRAIDHRRQERLETAFGMLSAPLWPLPNDPTPSRLTTLRLMNTSAPACTVEFILRQTPNLQSLVYDCKAPTGRVLVLPDLEQALDHVRATLTRLVIRFDPGGSLSVAALVMGTLGSLSRLPALKNLEISLGLLFGQTVAPESAPALSDVLPAGLKRLTITDDLLEFFEFEKWRGEPTGAPLKDFFGGAWKSSTPLLKKFVLDLRRNGGVSKHWEQEGNREELRQLVKSQGIRCSVLWDADRVPVNTLFRASASGW
jgi:hypothetical protein